MIIQGGKIYTEKNILTDAALIIKNSQIAEINSVQSDQGKHILFPENYHIVPGFIDLHIHGTHGKDVMDDDPSALKIISQALAEEGVTGFLATTMTAPIPDIEESLQRISRFSHEPIVGAQLLGIHLEGPFLSPHKAGAQCKDHILLPNIDYIKRWQTLAANQIKIVTLAPELEQSLAFIRFLTQHNIIAAIGHTEATYQEAQAAIQAGCTYATHLFNAMRGIHQREPGAISAALLSEVSGELIADGVHLHPAIVQLILKIKGLSKMVLVTDAMRAKCLNDGVYDLGGQAVNVKEGIARLPDGTLAGSTLSMLAALRNFMQFTACSLHEVLQLVSVNPAKILQLFHCKGSLAPGKDADLVVLNEHYEVVLTMVQGRIVCNKYF